MNVDSVNHPSHYTSGKIEVIDFIDDQQLSYEKGNVIKYVCRAGKKDPAKEIEDLKKAAWYIQREIKNVENRNNEKIIKYIVDKLTDKGFSVHYDYIDDCINMYVQKEKHYVKSVMSLTTLNAAEDKQGYIYYFINGIVEQFNTEGILKNWRKLVTENINNDIEEKKSSKEISMIDALENLGIELTPEEQDYFKDKVLTYVDIPGNYFTGIPDQKITITFNYDRNNSESEE